uniref:LRRNT domain-containing protein n=1 Tax=Octopus bimaculoides TaxID=37653 RepID=A0A0L8FP45_OCTBM
MSNQVRLFCRSLLTFLTLASIWTGTLGRCPRQCQCNDNKVLCMYKGLTNVVRVPLETTLLFLNISTCQYLQQKIPAIIFLQLSSLRLIFLPGMPVPENCFY